LIIIICGSWLLWLHMQSGQSYRCNPYTNVYCMLVWDCMCSHQANIFHVLQLWMFYRLYFIIQQRSREHFNLLIVLSCTFNNFVTLAKYKFQTPWRWCIRSETRRSIYGIQNIINIIYVVHLLVWITNCTRWMVHTLKQYPLHLSKVYKTKFT